jgi:hypothetical protein
VSWGGTARGHGSPWDERRGDPGNERALSAAKVREGERVMGDGDAERSHGGRGEKVFLKCVFI